MREWIRRIIKGSSKGKAEEKTEPSVLKAREKPVQEANRQAAEEKSRLSAGRTKSGETIRVGDIVRLGTYPQGADGERRPIEWTVMEVLEHKALLLSKYILDIKPFDMERESIFWNSCSLRTWLNHDFLKRAFTDDELEQIVIPENKAGMDEEIQWKMGRTEVDTPCLSDGVFLLKVRDIVKYFPGTESWACPGASAEESDWVKAQYGNPDPSWWLRTSMPDSDGPMGPTACIVSPVSTVGFSIISPDNPQGVRPAVFIKLDGFQKEHYSGINASFQVSTNGQKQEASDLGKILINCNAGTTGQQVQTLLRAFADALGGDASVACGLGSLYWHGKIVMQDDDLSFFWYKLAAKAGDADAQFDLADCYLQGVGVQPDRGKAMMWAQRAADQGLANAQANLGTWYIEDGKTEEGERLLRTAVEQHSANWEYADTELGRALMNHPDRTSKEEGLKWAIRAAEADYCPAFRLLCHVYFFGSDCRHPGCMEDFTDQEQGLTWMLRGSEQGEPFCQAMRAKQMLDADGDQIEEALEWAERSAAQDNHLGCYVCGCIFEMKGDFRKALSYFERAVALGDRASEPDVERMKEKIGTKK